MFGGVEMLIKCRVDRGVDGLMAILKTAMFADFVVEDPKKIG